MKDNNSGWGSKIFWIIIALIGFYIASQGAFSLGSGGY